jgi:hypothetical protein
MQPTGKAANMRLSRQLLQHAPEGRRIVLRSGCTLLLHTFSMASVGRAQIRLRLLGV